jgi:hypothetical protein
MPKLISEMGKEGKWKEASSRMKEKGEKARILGTRKFTSS